MSSFYLNTNTDLKVKRTFNIPFLTMIAASLLVILGIYNSLASYTKGTVTIAILLSALGLLSTVFSKAFNEYKVASQQPHLFAPEQFEECFNEMIAKAYCLTSFKFISLWQLLPVNLIIIPKSILRFPIKARCLANRNSQAINDQRLLNGQCSSPHP